MVHLFYAIIIMHIIQLLVIQIWNKNSKTIKYFGFKQYFDLNFQFVNILLSLQIIIMLNDISQVNLFMMFMLLILLLLLFRLFYFCVSSVKLTCCWCKRNYWKFGNIIKWDSTEIQLIIVIIRYECVTCFISYRWCWAHGHTQTELTQMCALTITLKFDQL